MRLRYIRRSLSHEAGDRLFQLRVHLIGYGHHVGKGVLSVGKNFNPDAFIVNSTRVVVFRAPGGELLHEYRATTIPQLTPSSDIPALLLRTCDEAV
jgi:hypothetical protein